MVSDYDEFGGFEGFGGFGRRRAYFPPLPEDIYLHGENPNNDYVQLILDGDKRLLLRCVSRIYFAFTVATIPSGSPGLLLAAPTDGYTRNILGIDIVNTTSNPVSCKLYWSEGTPSDTKIFGICGGNIAANSNWSYRGQLYLETKGIWGLAGTSSALRCHISVAASMSAYR